MRTGMTDEKSDHLWARRCSLLFMAWVQLRYQRRRQRFFDLADKLTKAVTLLLGASLFGHHIQPFAPWIGTAISAIGLLALVFTYGDRKQVHKELGEKAAALIKAIERLPAGRIDDAAVAEWSGEFAELVGKSPPPLKTLTILCEHEQASADGNPLHVRRPNLMLRCIANFY